MNFKNSISSFTDHILGKTPSNITQCGRCSNEASHELIAVTWEPEQIGYSCCMHIAEVSDQLISMSTRGVPVTIEVHRVNDDMWASDYQLLSMMSA